MTVDIDASLQRAQTFPTPMQTLGLKTVVSNVNSQIITQVSSVPSITSPSASLLSAPAANDSIINRKADPAQGLYQTCATLRKRLRDVPDFEQKFLLNDDGDEDPVNLLWRVFQKGSSLCVLFNALGPNKLIEDEKLQLDLGTKNACKVACFHFLKGIKEELGVEGEDTFMISHLWSEDTNGFVKVTRAVSRVLDELESRNLLLKRNDGEGDQDITAKPMDNRGRVVQELVDTERKYVQDLEALQDYMKALQASEVAPPDLIYNMFLNLNSLVDFQRRFLIRVETVYAQAPQQQRWGQVMISHENSFDVYEPYCANLNSAQCLAAQEAPRLAIVSHPVAMAGVTGFLIKPVQRITKYPLLLRDMQKYSDDSEQIEELQEGIAAIERVNSKVNESIRKVDMGRVTEDLAARVEDWKGHRLDQFGSLLLNGQFTVVKGDGRGDLEREYHIYLFQKILLCCKEIGPSKKQSKTMSMGKKATTVNTKKKSSLQLKGRIFMQNVTDIVWTAKNGNYTLQIFWKGDPGVEDFIIKHRNEETLNQWKTLLQQQVDLCHHMEGGMRSSGGTGKTSNTEFMWMQNSGTDPNDYGARSEEELTEDEDDDDGTDLVYTPSYSTSRNGSNSSLRSRSATNESGPPSHGLPVNPQAARQPRYTHQSHSSTSSQQPLLSLVTYPSAVSPGTQSPDRSANLSYFSPTSETSSMGSRGSTASNAYPFPRQPTPNYHDEARYPHGANMHRTSSREGSGPAAQAMASQRLQRPSLPGMSPGGAMQNRLRSVSSPNIHHVPTQAQLARSTGIHPVPVPPMPPTYQAYSGGPAVINRSQNNSPTSPMNGLPQRHDSPGIYDQARLNGSSKGLQAPQVKVRVSYANDIFVIIVPYNIAYHQLMDRIERKIRICGTNGQTTNVPPLINSIRIRYQDEDGDFITMNSDDDVQMAFDVFCDSGLTEGTIGIVTLHVQI